MFKQKLLSFLILGCLIFSMGAFALVSDVNAAANIGDTIRNGVGADGGLNGVAQNVYGSDDISLQQMIVFVINAILGLLGVIFLVLTIYAGFLWMTAAGNDDQVSKAKSIITAAIIGIVIIVAAYAITNFVLEAVLQ
ncbi:MAG: hypothetical protein WC323_02200 [Patescibacteria group bacterium]|jgi:hypothetical protein